MSLRLTSAKEIAISELCSKILNAHKVSIRTLAQLLGKFSSSFMAVPFGKLHYRALERFKTQSLKIHKGKFDRKVSLNPEARLDILWWRDNIKGSWSPIIRNNADIVKTTDASTIGWAAAKGEISTGGHFTETEKEQHINFLELMAALFGIRALCRHVFDKHILLKVDNTSAVSAINKMGSTRSLPMDKIVHLIWEWAISRNNWITVTHIPGILNIEADKKSREAETRTEWMLNKQLYRKVLNELKVHPTVDLFASRINLQKAFDTVDHKILLKKLEIYGFRGITNDWFSTYLSGRKQYVSVSGVDSNYRDIKHGVPQGSVLGPILFLIYINDLANATIYSRSFNFADDTAILYTDDDPKRLKKRVNIDLKLLLHWLKANKIHLNVAKTEVILFKHKQKEVNYNIRIKLDGKLMRFQSKLDILEC